MRNRRCSAVTARTAKQREGLSAGVEQAGIAQQVIVATTAGETAAVEEFQNLYRDFTPGTELIAEIGGAGAATVGVTLANQIGEDLDLLAAIVAIAHDRRDVTEARGSKQQATHRFFILIGLVNASI